jgi:hypothetical protein
LKSDSTSKGNEVVEPVKSTWDMYLEYFTQFPGLNDLVDEIYMDKRAYLLRVQKRQVLEGKNNQLQETEMTQRKNKKCQFAERQGSIFYFWDHYHNS